MLHLIPSDGVFFFTDSDRLYHFFSVLLYPVTANLICASANSEDDTFFGRESDLSSCTDVLTVDLSVCPVLLSEYLPVMVPEFFATTVWPDSFSTSDTFPRLLSDSSRSSQQRSTTGFHVAIGSSIDPAIGTRPPAAPPDKR